MLNRISLLVILLAFALAGCAGTDKPRVVYNDYSVRKAKGIEVEIRRANSLFVERQYKTASRIYSDLLAEYSSTDGSFETALLTNLCLISLEQGERVKFKDCAKQLKDVSKDLPYLSKETQMVIKLDDSLGNGLRTGDDLRIESKIAHGLNEIFKQEGR